MHDFSLSPLLQTSFPCRHTTLALFYLSFVRLIRISYGWLSDVTFLDTDLFE